MDVLGKPRKLLTVFLFLLTLGTLTSCGGGYYDDSYGDTSYEDYQSYSEPDYQDYEPGYEDYDPDYYDYEPDYYDYEPDYYEPDYGY